MIREALGQTEDIQNVVVDERKEKSKGPSLEKKEVNRLIEDGGIEKLLKY